MGTIERLRTAARTLGATIVFPEARDLRVLAAVAALGREHIVRPVLLGCPEAVDRLARRAGIDLPRTVSVVEPERSQELEPFANIYRKLLKKKAVTRADAVERLKDPLFFGAMLVRTGEADGCVAGAERSTGDVLQAALQVIGLAPAVRVASSVFLMVLSDGRTLTFGDCAVVPEPDPFQLAEIAVASARTHQQLTSEPAVVALLSFSTKGSAEHERVRKVREATALAHRMAPDLALDGELQFDAAFVEGIGSRKAPGSAVAGRANVFIFPNLEAGNIAYKIAERLAGAQAIGPIVQGLVKPMHDLSRGCKSEDIISLAAVCAVQARAKELVHAAPTG